MTSREFIIEKLNKFIDDNPTAKYLCEIDLFDNTFYIQIIETKKSKKLEDFKWKVVEESFDLYPYAGIVFLKESDVVKITKPDYIKEGKFFKKEVEEMNKKTITVNAIKCPKCGDEIYSSDRHDFTTCKCGAISIDGGLDYTKLNFAPGIDDKKLKTYHKEITKKEYLKKRGNREKQL